MVAVLAMAAVHIRPALRPRPGAAGEAVSGGFAASRISSAPAGAQSFTGDFTFCRLAYRQAYDGDGGGWGVDYPRADENLSIRLSELSKAPVNFDQSRDPNFYVLTPTDPGTVRLPVRDDERVRRHLLRTR